MREVLAVLGGDPSRANPRIAVDHSVIAEVSGRPDAFARNAELEAARNLERYQLLRWAQQAFDNVSIVPPDTGICHEINLEHLARVVFDRDGLTYRDTLVGTDSHTPMVNGLGVLGWGVGASRLKQACSVNRSPCSFLGRRIASRRKARRVLRTGAFRHPRRDARHDRQHVA